MEEPLKQGFDLFAGMQTNNWSFENSFDMKEDKIKDAFAFVDTEPKQEI